MVKRVKLPDGSYGQFPDEMPDAEIEAVLQKQFPPTEPPVAPPPPPMLTGAAAVPIGAEGQTGLPPAPKANPGAQYKDASIAQQVQAGMQAGIQGMGLGLKEIAANAVPDPSDPLSAVGAIPVMGPVLRMSLDAMRGKKRKLSEDDMRRLAEAELMRKNTGIASTLGEAAVDIAATGPVGKGVDMAAKGLPMAMQKLGNVGGRVLNLGTVGRSAAEGAISGALKAPEEGGSRAGAAAAGAGAGAVAPAAVTAVTAPVRGLYRTLSTGTTQATRRAYAALAKSLGIGGEEALEEMGKKLDAAEPTRLPQTTAALLDDLRLGELERGARARNVAAFGKHDVDVGKTVFDRTLDDTSDAALVAARQTETAKATRALEQLLETGTMNKVHVNRLGNAIKNGLTSEEAATSPQVRALFKKADNAINLPDVSNKVILDLYDDFAEIADSSPAAKDMMERLRSVGDVVSKGDFSRSIASRTSAGAAAKEAEAAQAVRRSFISDEGIPKTQKVYGPGATGRPGEMPKIEAGPLRKAIIAQEKNLEPGTLRDLMFTAEELRRHEIFKPVTDTGGTSLEMGDAGGKAQAAANAMGAWQAKGALRVIYGRADEATQAAIDRALLDPQQFKAVIAAKLQEGKPLSTWEQVLMKSISGQARAMGTGD